MYKRFLVALDFDGFLINSYEVIRAAFTEFGLDIGDEDRFKNRRKFLKYLGGGKELVRNLVYSSLPRKRKLKSVLTEKYLESGRIHGEFVPLINQMIEDPLVHVGVVSRNFTLNPGGTIRSVLAASGIDEAGLDFVIPIPVGSKKDSVLSAMKSSRYRTCVLAADEIGDYQAAEASGYASVIASYGFDRRERLLARGKVPEECIVDSPGEAVVMLRDGAMRRVGPRSLASA